MPLDSLGVGQYLLSEDKSSTWPTWVLTFLLAPRHGPEIVGIAKATAVKEMHALLTCGVEEVARHQPSTGTGSLR